VLARLNQQPTPWGKKVEGKSVKIFGGMGFLL
jgi:hypothetical protein